MSLHTNSKKPWSLWHKRLHKELKRKNNLLPAGSSLLISVSGGQDSIVLLQLIIDLQRLYKWKLHVWHGDHGWHENSKKIADELEQWCKNKQIAFSIASTEKNKVSTEKDAREWRYKNLIEQAIKLSEDNPEVPCKYVLTGHTGTDRAETFLMNLARGSHIAGLSSLRERRILQGEIELIRPMLIFDRQETLQICEEMNLPVWIDPSNSNIQLTRNRIRKEVLPVLEMLNLGCTMRISSLADSLAHLHSDQYQLTKLAIQAISNEQGIDRKAMIKLPSTVRAIIFYQWFKDNDVKPPSSKQMYELGHKIEKNKPPSSIDLSNGWKVKWDKELITLIGPSNQNKKEFNQ